MKAQKMEMQYSKWMYWSLAVAATVCFFAFTYTIMFLPGLHTSEKLWMLLIEGVLLATSLGIGIWNIREVGTFYTIWSVGMGVLLLLELTICIVSVIEVLFALPR